MNGFVDGALALIAVPVPSIAKAIKKGIFGG